MPHGKKKESILQWYNSLTTKGNVHSLAQFTDGSHFHDIITSLNLYSDKQNDAKIDAGIPDSMQPMDANVVMEEAIAGKSEGAVSDKPEGAVSDKPEETVSEKPKEAVSEKPEEAVSEKPEEAVAEKSEEAVAEKSVTQSTITNSPKMEDNGNIDSQKNYDAVKKFIDDFYHLDSTSLVNYSECMKSNELELAKVAVLLLSALVQHLLSTENQLIYTTTMLDQQVQEDIKECLSFVLSQGNGPLKKSEFHKILNRSAGCKGTPRRRHQSRSSGSTDHSEVSEGRKRASKKRKERASSIVYEVIQDSPLKTLLESPDIKNKAMIHKYKSEILKMRNAFHMEENKVFDLIAENSNLIEKLEKKNKEVESWKKECTKFREAAEESECSRVKEVEKRDEEIKHLNKLNQSKTEKIKQLEEVIETSKNKVEDDQGKLLKNTVIDCIGKSPIVSSVELSIKDGKIAHVEAENKKLKKKLKMLEETSNEKNKSSSSPKVPEVMSNITDGNENIKALLDKKEKEKNFLIDQLILAKNQLESYERFLQLSNKETDELKKEINRNMMELAVKESDLSTYQQQLDFFEKNCACLKSSRTNSNSEEPEGLNDFQVSSTNSNEFHSEAKNSLTLAEELGVLWGNVSNDSILRIKKRPVEFHSSMLLSEADFVVLKKMLRELVLHIKVKNYAPDSEVLTKLENELGKVECIKHILLAVSNIVDIIQLSKPNASGTNRRRCSDLDHQALILKKKKLEKENKYLTVELVKVQNNFTSQLEEKKNELKILKENCEEFRNSKRELVETINQVRNKAQESEEKYKRAKEYIKVLKVDCDKLKKMCSMLKTSELDKLQKNPYEECEKLKQKIRELEKECKDSELRNQELEATVKNHEGRMQNFECRVQQLEREKEELEFKRNKEVSFLSGTLSEREAIMLCYFNKAMFELDVKAEALKKTSKIQESSSMHTVSSSAYKTIEEKRNCFGESSMSIANRSIRSGCFQAADEEDFLNHSSLAEIHSGGITEDSNGEDRVIELRRRNTLCLPHLQSSYPLEIHNMTPSVKKYFKKGKEPWQPVNKTFVSEGEREFYRKQEAQFLGIDSEDSDSRDSFTLNKRKAVEDNSTNASKKIHRSSPVNTQKIIRAKPITPVQRRTNLLKKGSFRTPSRIRRFISMPHRNIKK